MRRTRIPSEGEKWCLESNNKKVATIVETDFDEEKGVFGSFVIIDAPYLKHSPFKKQMGTFIRQYKPVRVIK